VSARFRGRSRALADRRIRLLLVVFGVAFGCVLARAAWLQAVRSPALGELAAVQQRANVTKPAGRGTIYDRGGVPLALGRQAMTVYADPGRVQEPERVADAAEAALGIDSDALLRAISDPSRRFVYIARQADPDRVAELGRKEFPGVGFYPEELRVYPQNTIGSHVLGYAGIDNRGLAGVEKQLDPILSGRPGNETIVRDPSGRLIDVVDGDDARQGSDVYLTIDHVLQSHTETVLGRVVSKWDAQSATAIVLDVQTGGILAMANAPEFDANEFASVPTHWSRNRAVTDTFEPGSTFKVVTVSAALAERLVGPQTTFTLPPSIKLYDRVIHEDGRDETETMSVAQILSRSSNVGSVKLAQALGPERLDSWIRRFGFGRRTGIEFPGETRGIVLPRKEWSGATIGNVPIGQGIDVTPVQMAAAYGALANGGLWVQPHLVRRVADDEPLQPRRRRIVPESVAEHVLRMLRGVVREGSGYRAAVPGYQVAGKTGTAEKPDEKGYGTGKYVASFVGIVPVTAPRLAILVLVDEPQGQYYGGFVAAPAFRELARFALQYLEIPPDG
jgi:cell division protein FtsI (penicillin-binding protein 3)/stage V sporulation protein D (sporulation-specific penicillin-binding protein)